MTATEQPLYDEPPYDEEEPEPMPFFHYQVSQPGQPVRNLIAHGSDEAQTFGRISLALNKDTAQGPPVEYKDIVLISRFENPTVLQISGTISPT